MLGIPKDSVNYRLISDKFKYKQAVPEGLWSTTIILQVTKYDWFEEELYWVKTEYWKLPLLKM
jgi:hypothetical protein